MRRKQKAVLDGLLSFAEDDWLGLWFIANDVRDEVTLGLVRELLKRGLRAGDSPVANDAVHFKPWPDQDPEVIVDFIRQEWMQRGGPPGWGDGPWFAAEREPKLA